MPLHISAVRWLIVCINVAAPTCLHSSLRERERTAAAHRKAATGTSRLEPEETDERICIAGRRGVRAVHSHLLKLDGSIPARLRVRRMRTSLMRLVPGDVKSAVKQTAANCSAPGHLAALSTLTTAGAPPLQLGQCDLEEVCRAEHPRHRRLVTQMRQRGEQQRGAVIRQGSLCSVGPGVARTIARVRPRQAIDLAQAWVFEQGSSARLATCGRREAHARAGGAEGKRPSTVDPGTAPFQTRR